MSWAHLTSSIPDLIICQGASLPMPILFEFGLGTSLGWKEWVDEELSDMGFMAALQWADIGTCFIAAIWSAGGVLLLIPFFFVAAISL